MWQSHDLKLPSRAPTCYAWQFGKFHLSIMSEESGRLKKRTTTDSLVSVELAHEFDAPILHTQSEHSR